MKLKPLQTQADVARLLRERDNHADYLEDSLRRSWNGPNVAINRYYLERVVRNLRRLMSLGGVSPAQEPPQ